MIKVFTLNKNNKIELTKQELEDLLNESFWEGYERNNTYAYTSPYTYKSPYYVTSDNITVTCSNTASDAINIKEN